MTWLISPFADNPFLLRSLAAGVLVALACAITGTFVVLRGLAFLGDALAHGVLPGVAAALLLGVPSVIGAAAGAAVMIVGVRAITSASKLSGDTAVGLLFVGMLAVGVVMVSRSDTFTGDVVGILFGEILGISRGDLIQQVIALVVIALVAWVFARPFMMLAFDPEQVDIAGWSSKRIELLMLVMVAVSVVMSFQTVGTLLVFGMLLAPAGTGALLASRLSAMIGWASLFGVVSVYVGLLASYHFDLAAGASIVVCAVTIFFVVLVGQVLQGRQKPAVSQVAGPRVGGSL